MRISGREYSELRGSRPFARQEDDDLEEESPPVESSQGPALMSQLAGTLANLARIQKESISLMSQQGPPQVTVQASRPAASWIAEVVERDKDGFIKRVEFKPTAGEQ